MTPPPDDRPPLLGSWSRLYALLLGALALQILAFWLVTRAYA